MKVFIEGFEITWVKKRGLKNVYLQIKEEGIVLRSNYSYTLKQAQNLIVLKKNWLFKHTLLSEKAYHYLGQKTDKPELICKDNAENICTPMITNLCERFGFEPNEIRFRYTKSIWGSCSSHNKITLNINLLQVPLDVIEYVIIHELTHLCIKNHSRFFWQSVESLCPDYKNRRKLLREFESKIKKVLKNTN